jgi:hypothetical protein
MPQPFASQVALPLGTLAQAVAQSPQWEGSVEVSTQEPPQFVAPPGQSVTHLPAEHT